jgi:hypothetical protein
MTIPEILQKLESPADERFPAEAVKAAIEQREAITPHLLRALEAVAADPLSFVDKPDSVLHHFAIMLLAQFREKQACPLIISIFSAPGDLPDQIGGFLTQDSLGRVFASVYDGNPGPLQNLIENETISESVRDEAVRAFVSLARSNQISTQFVLDYFRALMREKLPREESNVWLMLVRAAADLPAPELMEDVRQAFDDGLIDPGCLTLEELEEEIETADPWREESYSLITDAAEEMELWPEYLANDPVWDEEDSSDDDNSDDGASRDIPQPVPGKPAPASPTPSRSAYDHVPQQPFVREAKIGRNDSCPCGSGKKYKKCCGKN